jgi:hypothetical protein
MDVRFADLDYIAAHSGGCSRVQADALHFDIGTVTGASRCMHNEPAW